MTPVDYSCIMTKPDTEIVFCFLGYTGCTNPPSTEARVWHIQATHFRNGEHILSFICGPLFQVFRYINMCLFRSPYTNLCNEIQN